MNVLRYEVNFLTEILANKVDKLQAIEQEFDFILMCQGMIKPFGSEARESLDRFIALSLRKLLCDEPSVLKTVCPGFKMPPLSGYLFECPGKNNEMMLYEINPDICIKPQKEWIPLDDWLDERIAWIEKSEECIPDAYEDQFFQLISKRIGNQEFAEYFSKEETKHDGKTICIWKIKKPGLRKPVYDLLKRKGYYDLTIKRMIKHEADKRGAHLDIIDLPWVRIANRGNNIHYSAISTFATHMIYAATKQIQGLKDYLVTNPMIETL